MPAGEMDLGQFIGSGSGIRWLANLGIRLGPPTGPVTLIIHSEIDRPILGFSVNGVAGANSSAHDKNNPYASGPGGSTCCGSISGNTAEVIWTLSTTRAQYDAGLRKETRRVVMPLPKRKWEENYLHVYFFPGDSVRLWW